MQILPSYFYHLAFELYRLPNKSEAYIPPQGTDIFEPDLPAHSTIPWKSSSKKVSRPTHRRVNTDHIAGSSSLSANSFPLLRTPEHDLPTSDWRFGAVTIESIDMDSNIIPGSSRPRGKSMTQPTSDASSGGGLATRATFILADPKTTDVGYGVVHLYRDEQETPGLYDDSFAGKVGRGTTADFKEDDCSTVCILAVPSYMMPSDLLGWAGEQAHDDVSHFRLIRTSKANRYMVLMKFREAKKARSWLKEYNGRAFSSMEPEYAHIVFVQSITFQSGDDIQQPSSFPNMSDDPFIPKTQPSMKTPTSATSENTLAAALTIRPLAPPPPNLVELPTCPVCL
jgi:BRCA1-associated protein